MKEETLSDRVGRIKARWLKRVMYESSASPREKCFAYAIADHLNCVTLDCWPSQETLSKRLRCKSVKTMQRATRGLVDLGLITIKQTEKQLRYAPIFLPGDDKFVAENGQSRPESTDKNVHESFLSTYLYKSDPTGTSEKGRRRSSSPPPFRRAQRGAIELKVAEWLGPNGIDVLSRLATIGDDVVDRLCRAYADGSLSERELAAAHLAAKQVR